MQKNRVMAIPIFCGLAGLCIAAWWLADRYVSARRLPDAPYVSASYSGVPLSDVDEWSLLFGAIMPDDAREWGIIYGAQFDMPDNYSASHLWTPMLATTVMTTTCTMFPTSVAVTSGSGANIVIGR